jgi:hypothetical protein
MFCFVIVVLIWIILLLHGCIIVDVFGFYYLCSTKIFNSFISLLLLAILMLFG